jgi:hypothetical protein
LKRRLDQQPLRGSREFPTVAVYEGWMQTCLEARTGRGRRGWRTSQVGGLPLRAIYLRRHAPATVWIDPPLREPAERLLVGREKVPPVDILLASE